MAIFPGAVATDANLYIAVDNLSTLLTDNPLTSGATTVNVASATLFPTVGFISIDAEIIFYTGKTATSFTGCTRGALGTTAASHVLNSQVDHNVVSAHHNASKDEIIAIQQNISDRFGLSVTQALLPNGTNALPSLTFASDPDTGIYRPAVNSLGFTTNGIARRSISTTEEQFNLQQQGQDGSQSAPTYSFANDLDTGLYRVAAGSVGISIDGTLRLTVGPSQTTSTFNIVPDLTASLRDIGSTTSYWNRFFVNDGTVALPSYTFGADSDTGIYRIGTNNLGISAAGSQVVSVGSNFVSIFNAVNPADQLYVAKSNSGGNVSIQAANLSDTAGSASRIIAYVEGTSAGDPILTWIISGGSPQQWAMGPDNSDLDSFVLAESGSLGTSNRLRIPTGGQFQTVDGSAGIPTYSFISDTNTGIFWRSADSFGFSAGGVLRATLNTTGFSVDSGSVQILDGTAGSPSLQFGTDPDTGIYRPAANQLDITAAGARVARFDGATGNIWGNSSSSAAPSFAFVSDTDTGIYNPAANSIGFATNGNNVLTINSVASMQSAMPTTDDTERVVHQASGSGAAIGSWKMYTTTSLTTAKTIAKANNYCDMFLVAGRNNADTAHFGDIIFTGFITSTINVVSSSGVATVRTYSKTGTNQDVKVALASDTWTIHTLGLEASNR